jgi:glycosyltransferase involved in cell wall biosynthesis
MRVLVANKFWYRRGGLERVMFDEIAWLVEAGHEVAHFSTTHPDNMQSDWAAYFVEYLELGASGNLPLDRKIKAAGRMFHNGEAARRFERLVADFRPDVVHAHGIHRQISPSILEVARRHGVPVVQTLHDYHHVCPADQLLYGGCALCDPPRCRGKWTVPAIVGSCVHRSAAASCLSALETSWSRHSYKQGIARFIAPSRFMMDAMRAGGWNTPIDHVPNPAPPVPPRDGAGDGFVVVGRLAAEKGVEDALKAARKAGVRIRVVGTGPLQQQLALEYPDATFYGHRDSEGVEAAIRGARAVVVPSVWFENASMSVLEALAAGVPVIATALGGTPELVTDHVEGLLVPPGDSESLAQAMCALESDADLSVEMGSAGRRRAQEMFSPESHLCGVLGTYARAISGGE